ncbi:BTAD domain-containing putative transcriptional regulator [Agromyces sp. LHK192]|uniref:ATP-binding protein n=1 Tax=Agromyces sp. LHK192 TaxID=2498704 RepID=UPI00196A34CD|nr:BTAD domain-containing putative transcriptional regulator [Agromyces sp. LHK192]
MAVPDGPPHPDGASGAGVRFQILGPMRIWREDTELDPGPPQQADLLALLLAHAGAPVSSSVLIDALWGPGSPPSAANSLHRYVGALRRLLEPDIGTRVEGRYIVRRSGGYLCTAPADGHDLVTFRSHLNVARLALARQRYPEALDAYADALDVWRGPAGAGLVDRLLQDPVFAALNAEFLDACTAAGALAVQLDQPERVIGALRLGVSIDPLHEPAAAGLMTVLAAAGHQAAALAVFRSIRSRLSVELGIEPSAALETAHRRVLDPVRSGPSGERRGLGDAPAATVHDMVGRAHEVAILRDGFAAAAAGDASVSMVVGQPGIGKTRLLEEIAAVAVRAGARVAWGRCRQDDGTPTLWPWVEIARTLVEGMPEYRRTDHPSDGLRRLLDPFEGDLTSPVLPDSGARFRLFEQVVDLVRDAATRAPVVLLVDDIQWADPATVHLLEHLAARLPRGVALIGALRDRAPAPSHEIVHLLAAISRASDSRRIQLRGLGPTEVAELVRRQDGVEITPSAARHLLRRTAGNPFFVRELSRSLNGSATLDEEMIDRAGTPDSIIDLVRDRVSNLDPTTAALLQTAAVIGAEIDLAVLATATGTARQNLLGLLAPAESEGLVELAGAGPQSLRFAHDLMREAVIESTPRSEMATIHLRIANALEDDPSPDPIAVERAAFHLWAAGPAAAPDRTARALIDAGRLAASKSTFDAADAHLRAAAALASGAGLEELELAALTELIAVTGMRTGYVGTALEPLERAERIARRLGREREATDLLFSRWAAHSQGIQLDVAAGLARRLLLDGQQSSDGLVQAYGWSAWGIHQWDIGDVSQALHHLRRANSTLRAQGCIADGIGLRRDLQLLWPVMLALMTALSGELDEARSVLDAIEVEAGDDAYAITVWAAFSVVIAAVAGEVEWARRAAARGMAVDPASSFVFLGGYQRLASCWARALSGERPGDAAAEAERIILAVLADPARSGLSTWWGLHAEMLLAAGRPDDAAAALDRADRALDAYGQRYAEGLVLLLRARVLHAQGADPAAVVEMAERSRRLSAERGAGLFAARASRFLGEFSEHR